MNKNMLLKLLHTSKPIRFCVTILIYQKVCSTQPEPNSFKTKTLRHATIPQHADCYQVVRSSARVPVGGTKRAAVDAVKPRKVHQGSGGKTYAWVPTSKPCCKRKCFSCVTDPTDPSVVAARQPLFDTTLTRPELRSALTDNHLNLLLHPDGQPVCVQMACRINGLATKIIS